MRTIDLSLPVRCLLLLICVVAVTAIRSHAEASGPFTWGVTTHVANTGWGRMIRLADGRWLSVGTLYPSSTTNTLQLQISTDNARTWKKLSGVEEPGRRMDNGELIQLPNGTILLSGRSVIENASFHFPVYQSKNNGATWTFLSMAETNDAVVRGNQPSQGLWEPKFFLLPHGKLGIAYASEKHSVGTPAYSQICEERVSSDNGATWGPEIVLVSQVGGGGLRPGMPVVIPLHDGRYFEICEVVGLDNAAVFFKISPDGVHWPSGLGTSIAMQHAGPWVASLADGRLVVTSCSNQVSTSLDNGRTWTLSVPPAWNIGFTLSFPAIYQTGPREIAVMNTHDGVHIRFGSFVPRKSKTKSKAASKAE